MILLSIITRYYVDCDGLQICANNVIYNIYDFAIIRRKAEEVGNNGYKYIIRERY